MSDTKLNKDLEIYVLGEEYKICKNLKYFPLASYPSYTQMGLIIYCLRGSARISIHGNEHILVENELVVILPGQLVAMAIISDDFLTHTQILSQTFYEDVLCGVRRFSPHFYIYMRTHFWYTMNRKEVNGYRYFFGLLFEKAKSSLDEPYRDEPYRMESIVHLLRYFYLDLYALYQLDSNYVDGKVDDRKEEIANQFFKLIMKFYKQNRDVAFYADKLFITSKYLSMVLKEVSGKSAKDWILEYIVLEIKALLKNTTLNIQQIATKTNFSNQSSLGRFFRKHTGMSLLEYRTQKWKFYEKDSVSL